MKNSKTPMILTVVLLLALSGGMGYGAFHYTSTQNAKIKLREAEIENMRQNEIVLNKRIQSAEEAGKQILEQNNLLKESVEKFEGEKTAILSQVRSSVASFEAFRGQATEEINKLNTSLTQLQNEKKDLTEKLQGTENMSKAQQEELNGKIQGLNQKIEEHKQMETVLTASLESKQKVSMVVETAKLHYNLGNFYFHNQNFENAAREYKKALFYTPNDPDMNFNLAVVCDEYLDDRPTAIAHYRKYLELNPKAREEKQVRQRILDLGLEEQIYEDIVSPVGKKKYDEKNIFDPAKEKATSFELMRDKK